MRDGLLFKRNLSSSGARFLLVVPESLRTIIMSVMHDDPTSGHLGLARTLHRTKERFYWPGMQKSVESYVASCMQCQRHKRPSTGPAGLLQPMPTPGAPFEQVRIDFLGPFPKSAKGNRWVIVCVDYHTRYYETAAVPSATASEVSSFFVTVRHPPTWPTSPDYQ
uniref:RNA-directed DNA polymerase n=1 Tax=Rhipicephalus microplus TaxID=6941 RepID=A0A6G5A9V3_RHIMP